MFETKNPNLVFDIGPCEGNDTAFYLKKGFQVLAVEANPKTAEGMRHRFEQEIAERRLTVVNAAAFEVAGQDAVVWDTKDPGHSTVGWNPHQVTDSFVVKTVDWAVLVEGAGVPYYCKIDIEGAEEGFLRSVQRTASRPTYMSVECHTADNIGMLFALGYRKFKLINQTTLDSATVPDPALEGLYVPETNHMHGSGLFGRELQGAKWFDFQEITGLYDAIHRLRAYPEILRSWYDCHAWMPE